MSEWARCDSFCAGRTGATPSAALERALESVMRSAVAAWPDFTVDDTAFLAHLGACTRGDDGDAADASDATLGLEQVHASDLYLAFACARGAPPSRAIEAFARAFLPDVESFLGPSGNADLSDEVRQILLERFFVGGSSAPKILDYAGRGPLRGWLRVAAVRAALSLRRRQKSDRAEELDALVSEVDPELDAIKVRYKDDFQRALADALDTLAERDRALLKLHYLDGVPVERLGALYGVHRGSASRWLSSARSKAMDEMKRLLRERLSLTDSQFASVAALVKSQLDLSLRGALRTRER